MRVRFNGAGPVDHPASGLVFTPGAEVELDLQALGLERSRAALALPGLEALDPVPPEYLAPPPEAGAEPAADVPAAPAGTSPAPRKARSAAGTGGA